MKEFVVSCNPINFDIGNYFTQKQEIVWKQSKKCSVGDYVYIYVGRPLSCLKYICKITETDLLADVIDEAFYKQQHLSQNSNTKYMRLKFLKEIEDQKLPLRSLLDNGLKTVQCTTEVCSRLSNYIRKSI